MFWMCLQIIATSRDQNAPTMHKRTKRSFWSKNRFFYEICLMLSEILLSGVQSNIMYSTCVQFPLGRNGYWGVRLRTLCIFFKYLVHNGLPFKNQRNKCRNNKGNSNPLFKLANDREQVTRVLSSPSEQLLGKGLKQQAGLNKRHKKQSTAINNNKSNKCRFFGT